MGGGGRKKPDTFQVVCYVFCFCFGRGGWGNVPIRESLERKRFLKINLWGCPGAGAAHRFSGFPCVVMGIN